MLSQKIVSELRNDIGKKLSNDKLQLAAKKMAKNAININIRRILDGVDVNGKGFKEYTKKYATYKKRYIKYGRKYSQKYGANGMPSHIRLSGQLLSSFGYDSIQVTSDTKKIKMSFRIFVDKDNLQRKKIEGLYSDTGKTKNGKTYKKHRREFFGLAKPNAQGSLHILEKNELINEFQRDMGFAVSGRHEDIKIG